MPASTDDPVVHVAWADEPAQVDAAGDESLLGRSAREWRSESRRALGVRGDGPLVVTGHQAGPWHPGILAKYAALQALGDAGAATLDLLVEHDVGDPLRHGVPVRAADGSLHVRTITWGAVAADRSMMRHDPVPITRPRLTNLAVDVADRLSAWGAALGDAAEAAPHLAGQVRAALVHAFPHSAAPPADWVGTERLLGTAIGRALVAEMVRDPWRCAAAYARATRRHLGVGIPPLLVRDDFVELPLWRIMADGQRRRADDVDAAAWLEGGPDAPVLVPRALMLTAVVRLGVADCFIHGRGGGVYDHVMRDWIADWIGARPAPAIVVSADQYLELGVGRASVAASSSGARLAVDAHRTWHDPEPPAEDDDQAGGRGPGPVKRELLAAIDASPRGSAARRRAWSRMHMQLEALRGVHVGRVEAAQRRARDATIASAAIDVAGRRDWFALLHDPSRLGRLADAVRDDATLLAMVAGFSGRGRG